MLALGPLGFAAPWALGALALLPVLWWLLKITPPSPRTLRFPAVRLLLGLESREESTARTPWWVLALRLAAAALVILAVAQPLIHPAQPLPPAAGPLVIAVDDGWAAARDWAARRAYLDELLGRAERAGRPVLVLPTAPPADGGPVAASPMATAAEARARLQALDPKPWPTDLAAATAAVAQLPRERSMQAVWLSDGLDDGHATELARALQSLGGGLEVVTGRTGRVMMPPATDTPPDQLALTVRRLAGSAEPERVAVRGTDGSGRVLGREEAGFAPGQGEARIALRMPAELRNRLARIDIEGEQGAAAVALLDESWRRRPVGLADVGAAAAPLLGPLYYVEKALAPTAELSRGDIGQLLDRDLAVLMLADGPQAPSATGDRLARWIEGGGILVRFAGPALAHAATEGGETDPFLPVRLRAGGRSLGGAMSWTTPQGLAPFPESGPFAGLAVPADVSVNAQVLAEPTVELADRTWARLADGTPLVTGQRRGKGWVVLFHTTANAEWSNLALSGLFPDMLRRLVGLAEGVATPSSGPLAPAELLDGYGHLGQPGGAASALSGDLAAISPGPRHPPGIYGSAGARIAFNLGPRIGSPSEIRPPGGVALTRLGERQGEIDLKPALLAAALVLAIIDLMVALALRGLLPRAAAGAVLLGALAGVPPPAHAGDFALDAALSTRLAYVRTGDATIDRKSRAGLAGLSRVLADRSTASMADPMAIDLDHDPVLFFPLLYWPVTAGQKAPSAAAVDKLNDYMRRGGVIVFDTGADGDAAPHLRDITRDLAVPPLARLGEDHVLTRSFYLLKEAPGRFDAGPIWVEDGAGPANDGVSPVVVGGNDWAGAWAVDDQGRPLFAAVPGGERQRELAYRFGVNLVMYALTGNYKADQVHLPAILERLGR
ncbi:MAG: DUF4159 domain-containing protein [Solirubrobacterales bacterium]